MKCRPNNDGITNGGGGGFVKGDGGSSGIPNGDGITECRDGTCSECCKRKS